MAVGIRTAAPVGWTRAAYRPVMVGLALLFVTAAVAVFRVRFGAFDAAGAVAIDYRTFVDVGHRFLATGSPFQPYQLEPYAAAPAVFRQPADVPFLYPPTFVPVALALTVLPWIAWWAVPLALLGWCVASWRPSPLTWPLLALALAWPNTSAVVIVGGSTMWAVALTAAGLRFGWPAALILLKPSLLPFALTGIRRRSWWITVALLGAGSLVFLPLWPDYVTAMRNATDVRWWYSLGDLPFLLLPVVAYLGRQPRM